MGQVREVLTADLKKLLMRGDTLEDLQDRSDQINQSAQEFHRRSQAVRRAQWWLDVKLMVILAICVLLVLISVISSLYK